MTDHLPSTTSITCFGEIMLRLSPLTPYERLEKTHALKMEFAGAESNVAVSLAKLGQRVSFVTCLPDNNLGQAALNDLRQFGVETDFVQRSGKRIGTYFIEYGNSLRPSQVLYDRANSAIAEVDPNSLPWSTILKGKEWLFLSGITPALSPNCLQACKIAVAMARSMGVKVAFDFNYRRTLWKAGAALEAFNALLPGVDLLFGNFGSVADVFGWKWPQPETWLHHEAVTRQAINMVVSHYGLQKVAFTVRHQQSASRHRWGGVFYDRGTFYESRPYEIDVLERLGGGDAFAAGVIHGLCQQWSSQNTLDFATAAAALKHTIPGDLNLLTEAEIAEVAGGNIWGTIKR